MPKRNDDPIDDENLMASGWGRLGQSLPTPEQLIAVQLPVVNRTYDQLAGIQNKTHKYLFKLIQINNHMFCAGFEEGGKGVCYVRNEL